MRQCVIPSILCLSLLVACKSVVAAVQFSQSSDLNSGRASDVAFGESGFQTADNFSLGSEVTINFVSWFGGHDFSSNAIPLTDNFTIQFYTDAGGQPSLAPFASYNVGNSVNRIDTGDNYSFGSDHLQYSADISGTEFDAGTTYYLSIFADTSTTSAGEWFWASSGVANRTEWERSPIGVGPWNARSSFSHAFALDGSTIPDPIEIDLDIKPGPSNNTVPLNGNGTLQMAILANEEFNVMDVNIASLLFGDPILVDGGATPLGATSDRLRDLNHDGLDDLLVGFSISDLVDGGALDASSVEGRLTGELLDGTQIIGSDVVRMVPQNNNVGGLATSAIPEPTTSAPALAALFWVMSRRRSF